MTTDTITANSGSITLDAGIYSNPLTIASGVTIAGPTGGSYAIANTGQAFTVDNFGTVTADYYAVIGNEDLTWTNETGAYVHGGRDGFLLQSTTGTIVNDDGATITGGNHGVYGANSVINAGSIGGGQVGVWENNGGELTNISSGSITGDTAVRITGASGHVDNSGSLIASGNQGVYLGAGGSVTNETGGYIKGSIGVRIEGVGTLVNHDGAAIVGTGNFGIYAGGSGSATIDNAGSISGSGYGLYIGGSGGSVTNEAGGTIQGGDHAGVYANGAATLENAGSIGSSNSDAVNLHHGGSVTNSTGGIIDGHVNGINAQGALTVSNDGHIIGEGNYGVYSNNGGTVDNQSHGVITGHTYGVDIQGSATVTNSGSIQGSYGTGVQIGGPGRVINQSGGTIASDHGLAIKLVGAGLISNASGATIVGINGVRAGYSGATTVMNDGSITATTGTALDLRGGGSVHNTGFIYGKDKGITVHNASLDVDNSGTIHSHNNGAIYLGQGGSVTNGIGGVISADRNAGIRVDNGSGTVINHGTISGTPFAVYVGDGGFGSVDNTGFISGTTYGVYIGGSGGSLVNEAGGDISGKNGAGVIASGASTVENAGTIESQNGYSVLLQGNGRLVVDAGAVFSGNAKGTGGSNTLELKAGGSGTITAFGSKYIGFETIQIDSGAIWDISGEVAGFGSSAINGFNNHDQLDLSDLSFAAGNTVTFDDTTNVLTIKNSGGSTLATLQLDDAADGKTFKLVNDGNGGTFAEESDYTPCYLKGTRIRTPTGDVAVESLRIGDLVTTAGGEALPLKWIGRRGYQDWMAIGNRDVQPVLFRAGSIARNVPSRDLYVSPEHAMFLDGMLVPAHLLTNGSTIVHVDGMREVEYFHLEFGRHAIILAEGAEAESFVDDDSRMMFHNAAEYRRLYPNEPRVRHAEFCAPRVEDGQALEAVRGRLASVVHAAEKGAFAAV